ncbi:hypothetical protein KEJ15_08180, partial [Candidatus Bathyarchaeota archaeon]|nr:hypothetical protein [Candidatus Bathyarchaeota archaeon]
MNHLTIAKTYTTIAFGVSIFLWPYLSSVSIAPSLPRGLAHPYFTTELALMLSIVIVWLLMIPISLSKLQKQKMSLEKGIAQNWSVIFLASATLVVAISGCIFYFQLPFLSGGKDDLVGMPPIPPSNPFALIYGFGTLFCEAAWIMDGIAKIFEKLHRRS